MGTSATALARATLLRGRFSRSMLVLVCLLTAPAGLARPRSGCRAAARYAVDIEAGVRDVAAVWPLPTALVQAIIRTESGFDTSAVSRVGAVGLMQVLPSSARHLGVTPDALWSPASNIRAGTRLLAVLLRHYQGDVISALVAYNARPRRPFSPLPENGETPRYVRAVLRTWAFFERCASDS